ncbi:HAAS signaling domain-containing protein [Oceanobacillus chungangensis]|uniref:Uncharacterized protein n=1 Tax=Oceanobacillus chungangensis TaxID=1229152 RepID=A0A3D8PLY6_9BACI|nr:hypothetical protein [Oceanobacillus chungangensis]RDW16248.1 hypothetical protein CWR45_15350 [Oceanobacillus chungangensis]
MSSSEDDVFKSIVSSRFFKELKQEIGDHSERDSIVLEYEMHVYDLLQEEQLDGEFLYDELVLRLGTPQELAKMWKQETSITPKKTQWLFVLLNIAMFIGGILLTISYNAFDWKWVEKIWAALTDARFLIILVYMLFWALLGYEIGKEFGQGGYKLLRKTFALSIIPNIGFMYLIVFKFIPYEWFEPLLSVRFIMICIFCTVILYPISWIGYRWGRRTSV